MAAESWPLASAASKIYCSHGCISTFWKVKIFKCLKDSGNLISSNFLGHLVAVNKKINTKWEKKIHFLSLYVVMNILFTDRTVIVLLF